MKFLYIVLWSLLGLHGTSCYAEKVGALLWEDGVSEQIISSKRTNSVLLLPGVSLGGKAQKNAVLIGIVDSGVSSNHPQLSGYINDMRDFTGEGLEDEIGHGTAVALNALFSMGEPPSGAIISAKVVSRDGKVIEANVIKAIKWLGRQKVTVVNLSLGFSGTQEAHQELCSTIAEYKDTIFAAAAGNSGPDVIMFPAACEVNNLLSVGATDEKGEPAVYSGRGVVIAPGSSLFVQEWEYFYDKAQKRARLKDYPAARDLYNKSIEVENNAESWYQLGLLDLAENKVDSAIVQLNKAIRINPALPEAYAMLGAAYLMMSDFAQAERKLRDAIDLFPNDERFRSQIAQARFNLGQTLLNLGRRAEARSEFIKTKRLVPQYPRIDEVLHSMQQTQDQ